MCCHAIPIRNFIIPIRDDILKQFWNKLQELNDTFVQTNIAAMRDSSVAGNSIGIFESVILDIVRYYDTNEFDLKVFKKSYILIPI